MTEKITELQKALNDLNSTARLARFLATQLPSAADATDQDDPNLWCVFDVIAERLESVDERLDAELAKTHCGPRLVDQGGNP